jgi:hypothetical protein
MPEASYRKLEPVALPRVRLTEGFWAERVETTRAVTLPIEYEQCKKTGRIDAWKWEPGQPNEPHIFWDSDVAKWIEAAAYSLTTRPDKKLERQIDAVVEMMAQAQGEDGYLNSHFLRVEPRKRWTNLRDWHELYCAGHLTEAAVAYHEATGKREFLDVMRRYADHIDRVFGRKKGQKRGYPGHEEIELALVKLYRATGERRYLSLAKSFVNERGRRPHYYDLEAVERGEVPKGHRHGDYRYNQSHLPVREQTEVVGHAVRACYLYAGMADVAAETGDRKLAQACRRLWKNLTEKRLYVTGGVGPTSRNEGFTIDYDLPNESAYAETCAAIALVFWAHRMLHLDADAQYADVMERALYNGVLSGISLDGKRFFYANPLAVHPAMNEFSPGHVTATRQEWFGCACCPPNVARLLTSIGGYMYSKGRNAIWVHLYGAGAAEIETKGQTVSIEQKTEYPWQGRVRIHVAPERPSTFALALRVPGWCRQAKVMVNGKAVALGKIIRKGYAHISREWKSGDKVDLELPMPVERIEANPKVRQDCGRVALQRGPLVYCLEEADNGRDLSDLALPRDSRLRVVTDRKLFGGTPAIMGKALRRDERAWKTGADARGALYRPAGSKTKSVTIKAVPYFLWANRREGEMVVWIREA